MRLSGQIKMGYYPTPASTLPLITSYLSAARPDTARLLDPCCGEGEALAYVAQHLATQDTWGAELSPDRANAARNVLGKEIGRAHV